MHFEISCHRKRGPDEASLRAIPGSFFQPPPFGFAEDNYLHYNKGEKRPE